MPMCARGHQLAVGVEVCPNCIPRRILQRPVYPVPESAVETLPGTFRSAPTARRSPARPTPAQRGTSRWRVQGRVIDVQVGAVPRIGIGTWAFRLVMLWLLFAVARSFVGQYMWWIVLGLGVAWKLGILATVFGMGGRAVGGVAGVATRPPNNREREVALVRVRVGEQTRPLRIASRATHISLGDEIRVTMIPGGAVDHALWLNNRTTSRLVISRLSWRILLVTIGALWLLT